MFKRKGRAKLLARIDNWDGDNKIYRLSPPMEREGRTIHYVLVRAVEMSGVGPMTNIYQANPNGTWFGHERLPGSFKGDTDHQRALRAAGYKID